MDKVIRTKIVPIQDQECVIDGEIREIVHSDTVHVEYGTRTVISNPDQYGISDTHVDCANTPVATRKAYLLMDIRESEVVNQLELELDEVEKRCKDQIEMIRDFEARVASLKDGNKRLGEHVERCEKQHETIYKEVSGLRIKNSKMEKDLQKIEKAIGQKQFNEIVEKE